MRLGQADHLDACVVRVSHPVQQEPCRRIERLAHRSRPLNQQLVVLEQAAPSVPCAARAPVVNLLSPKNRRRRLKLVPVQQVLDELQDDYPRLLLVERHRLLP